MKIIALILIVIGTGCLIHEILMIRKGKIISGKVSEIIVVKDSEDTTFKPRITYRTKNNVQLDYEPSFSSGSSLFKKGDKVKLLTYKDGRRMAIRGILHFRHRFLFAYLMLVLGGSILLFSIDYNTQLRVFAWIKHF